MRSSTVASGSSRRRDAEVEHAHAAVAAEQHVGGLHVTVHDAVLVRVRDPGAHGRCDAQQCDIAQLPFAAARRAAVHALGRCRMRCRRTARPRARCAGARRSDDAACRRRTPPDALAGAARRVVRMAFERDDLLALEVETRGTHVWCRPRRARRRCGSGRRRPPEGEQRRPLLTGELRASGNGSGRQGVRGGSGGVSARPARALTSGCPPAAARMRRPWGVIVVRQGNRAVLLRRVRSRRRPPDGEHPPVSGPWQARGGSGPGHAQDPGGGRRRARPGAGLRHPQLLLRVVEGRSPTAGTCRTANSVARQSNTDAKALDAALYNQELTPDQVISTGRELDPPQRASETTAAALKPSGQDQAAGSPALPAAGAAIPHAWAAGSRGRAQGRR